MIGLVVAAIAASVAAGVAIERRSRLDARRFATWLVRAMLWVATPFATFFIMARLQLDAGVGIGLLLAYAAIAAVGATAYLVATRVLRLSRPQTGSVLVLVVLANTGYLGVPLTATLLGTGTIGAALAFDTIVSGPMFWLVGFAVGAAFGTRGGGTRAQRLRGFLRNPPLIAVIAGLIAPDSLAPDVLLDAAHVVVYALLPCGFVLVGIALATEAETGALAFPPRLDAAVASVMALRLVVAPLLLLGLSSLVIAVPHAYLLQAGMPSGINSLVIAHAYGLDLRLSAAAVTWTTLAGVLIAVTLGVT